MYTDIDRIFFFLSSERIKKKKVYSERGRERSRSRFLGLVNGGGGGDHDHDDRDDGDDDHDNGGGKSTLLSFANRMPILGEPTKVFQFSNLTVLLFEALARTHTGTHIHCSGMYE